MANWAKIKNLLEEDDVKSVFKLLSKETRLKPDQQKVLSQLKARFAALEMEEIKSGSKDSVEMNQLRMSLLTFAEKICESKGGNRNSETPLSKKMILALLLVAVCLSAAYFQYESNENRSHDNEVARLLPLTQQMPNDPLERHIFTLGEPKSILDGEILFKPRKYYSKVKIEFEGIYSVSKRTQELGSSSSEIVVKTGDRFYIRLRESIDFTIAANVISYKDSLLEIEIFEEKLLVGGSL